MVAGAFRRHLHRLFVIDWHVLNLGEDLHFEQFLRQQFQFRIVICQTREANDPVQHLLLGASLLADGDRGLGEADLFDVVHDALQLQRHFLLTAGYNRNKPTPTTRNLHCHMISIQTRDSLIVLRLKAGC